MSFVGDGNGFVAGAILARGMRPTQGTGITELVALAQAMAVDDASSKTARRNVIELSRRNRVEGVWESLVKRA